MINTNKGIVQSLNDNEMTLLLRKGGTLVVPNPNRKFAAGETVYFIMNTLKDKILAIYKKAYVEHLMDIDDNYSLSGSLTEPMTDEELDKVDIATLLDSLKDENITCFEIENEEDSYELNT